MKKNFNPCNRNSLLKYNIPRTIPILSSVTYAVMKFSIFGLMMILLFVSIVLSKNSKKSKDDKIILYFKYSNRDLYELFRRVN